MRIAHFIQRYPPALGGSEAYFARLSRYLVESGDAVAVFTTNAIDLEAFGSLKGECARPGRSLCDGVDVRRHALLRVPFQRYLVKALSLLPGVGNWFLSGNPLALGLLSAGKNEKFDLVHATAFPYSWPLLCARHLARRLGVPFVLTPFVHLGDLDNPKDRTRRAYLQPALRNLARSADRVFVQTEGERQALLERGLSPDRLVLQGMGVDADECTGGARQTTRAEWGVKPDEIVVGHLANNSQEKGTVDLLRTAELAWRRGARVRIVLAGPEMPNFRLFWASYRSALHVQRLGSLSESQKRNFFAAIDLFALPSKVDSFGLVLLEAWANGVANVAYRAGGFPWVIRHEQDGLLVRCGDIEGLATALQRLAEDPALHHRLGAAGRGRLATDYRWRDKLELVRQVYRELIEAHNRTPEKPL